MKSYINNKRKYERIAGILSICFWVLNFSFVQVCISMFTRIIMARKSDWLDEGLKRGIINDPFLINRTDLAIKMMMLVMGIIIIFAIVSIVLFRNIQLKNIMSQIAMYRVLGYSKRKIIHICMMEPVADIIIAYPISIILSTLIWKLLSKFELVYLLIVIMGDNIIFNMISHGLCATFMVLITIIHTKIFMERSLKKGIRYMLGQGVE